MTVAELSKKGSLEIRAVPLKPRRDMVEIKGSYNELTLKSFYENTTLQDDYVHITLTDEEDIPDGIGKLRSVYKNLMKLDYDNTRTRTDAQTGVAAVEKTPFELFYDFYEIQNNRPFSDEQAEFVKSLLEKITEDE